MTATVSTPDHGRLRQVASSRVDSHLVMILAAHQAANPSTLKLSDVFTPLGIEILENARNTQPVHHLNDTITRLFPLKGPLMNAKPTNWEAWEAAVAAG